MVATGNVAHPFSRLPAYSRSDGECPLKYGARSPTRTMIQRLVFAATAALLGEDFTGKVVVITDGKVTHNGADQF